MPRIVWVYLKSHELPPFLFEAFADINVDVAAGWKPDLLIGLADRAARPVRPRLKP